MSVKFRRWWLVISIPLVVGLVTAEILLQVYYRYTGTYYSSLPATIRANEPYPRVFYEAHPFLPYALKPTRRVWINNDRNSPPRQNRAAWIDHRVNAYGARGPEISAKKAPGTVRVAVIGGSTTFSVHTREADSWPRVLQDLLNEKAGGAGTYRGDQLRHAEGHQRLLTRGARDPDHPPRSRHRHRLPRRERRLDVDLPGIET